MTPGRPLDGRDIGLVHDYLLVMRGAERTFAAIADCWPQAPIHTTLYDADHMRSLLGPRDVRVSPLQRLGVRQRGFRALLPLFPWAVERLDVAMHDVVVSSSSAFAHGVRCRPGAVHVCYCYSPFRYAWHERATALREAPRPLWSTLNGLLDRIQDWDRRAHARVTHHIAISRLTQRRIAESYGRDSTIVHPPVEVERFAPRQAEDWFLIVGALVNHKRIEIALEGAARAGVRVKVVGNGPERGRLARLHPGVEFLGHVDDSALAELYSRARALIVPNVEEFGIAAVEAQAAGRPVVARAEGGTCETVIDGETGILLPEGTVGEIAETLRYVDFDSFSPATTRANAERFSVDRFRERLVAEVERVVVAN